MRLEHGDVWVEQDSGGDLEFFVWEYDGQGFMKIVSPYHATPSEALEAARQHVSEAEHRHLRTKQGG